MAATDQRPTLRIQDATSAADLVTELSTALSANQSTGPVTVALPPALTDMARQQVVASAIVTARARGCALDILVPHDSPAARAMGLLGFDTLPELRTAPVPTARDGGEATASPPGGAAAGDTATPGRMLTAEHFTAHTAGGAA